MKFAIITHVPHLKKDSQLYAYAPYVREMNLWDQHVDEVLLVAPYKKGIPDAIHLPYEARKITFMEVPGFNAIGLAGKISALLKMPKIAWTVYMAMKKADHIHLRCPGNMGLLGCLLQIFFPAKPKTAKYAGNWDPKSKQPSSYRFQKRILGNTFLTKNMQVLVYGEWPHQTKNIKPFFTATYSESDKEPVISKKLESKIKLLFAGTLSKGKRPMYAVRLAEMLCNNGHDVQLELYGDGAEREQLQHYILEKNLGEVIFLLGNQAKEKLQEAYKNSHFLILPSQSEGWPKVVAEAMFWGCVPVSSPVSCIPNMLGDGERGILLDLELEKDSQKIMDLIKQPEDYHEKAEKAVFWSRKYTLDYFENEIKLLLKKP